MFGLKTTETLLGIETHQQVSIRDWISLKTTETLLGIETIEYEAILT